METNSFSAVATVLSVLTKLDIPHMVVGSFSSNAYSFPRATKDADIVVEFKLGDLDRVTDFLDENFYVDRQMSFETITHSVRNVLTWRPTGFDIELFRLNDDSHHQQRFARRVKLPLEAIRMETWLPTPEDVIIQKLRWKRHRDLADARQVVASQMEILDWPYLYSWTDQHETTELLDEIRTDFK